MRGWKRGGLPGLALGVALGIGAGPARAADAPALEGQLHDWLANLLGPRVDLGERPVRATAQGDGFALAMPIAGPIGATGITIDGAPATATARGLDDGRWTLDDIRLPSPLSVSAATEKGRGTWTLTLQDQDNHAVIDPSLATTSTWDSRIGGYSARSQGPQGEQHTEAAHVVTHITWQPVADGRVDVTETASTDLLSSTSHVEKVGLVSLSAAHARLDAHLDALAPGRVPPLVHAVLDVVMPLMASASAAIAAGDKPPKPEMTPQMRTALVALVDAAGGLIGGFGERVRLEDVHLQGPMGDGALQAVEFGTSAAAPDGRLQLRMHIGLDGLDSAMLRDGPLHAYLPHHIALTPRLSGVQADRVLALLRRAAATGGEDPTLESDAEAIVHDGPLAIGLDTLTADFGPATLTGSGEMRVLGRDEISGHAHVQVTGLNDLIHDAQTVPMLRQAEPGLIFLKGIGSTEGTTTVWDIAYIDGKLTVNGTDMSQMMPGK